MKNKWPFKDPDEVLDYEIDWEARIGTDTISTATWTIPSGLVKDSDSTTDYVATVWLSGGTAGTNYSVGCRVVTEGGRTYDETVILPVKSR